MMVVDQVVTEVVFVIVHTFDELVNALLISEVVDKLS
jgi:cellobiose-specific phosphotransferase system component IIA